MTTTNQNLEFCPRLRDMLQSGRLQLPNGESVAVMGTSTLNNLKTIRHFILKEKIRHTLEIGLAYGASALNILATLKEVHGSEFHHTAIDPFQTADFKSAAIHLVDSEGLGQYFTHLEQDSSLALPSLVEQNKSYGLIYVDGSHIFENVFVDFFFCTRLLPPKGLILFDDCVDSHVRKVIRFIDTNYSEILRREDLKEAVPERSLKKRIGNALGIQQLVAYRKIGEPPRKWNVPFARF